MSCVDPDSSLAKHVDLYGLGQKENRLESRGFLSSISASFSLGETGGSVRRRDRRLLGAGCWVLVALRGWCLSTVHAGDRMVGPHPFIALFSVRFGGCTFVCYMTDDTRPRGNLGTCATTGSQSRPSVIRPSGAQSSTMQNQIRYEQSCMLHPSEISSRYTVAHKDML